jgi:predicted RecB family endonuclease
VFTFKPSKHDQYIKQLCSEINEGYDSISTNIKLKKKKRFVGEIDVLAKKGNSFDLYEVKCSYRITKAKKQAKSLRKHFGKKISNIYFYCGATSSLILI